jgi:hypothetical protein
MSSSSSPTSSLPATRCRARCAILSYVLRYDGHTGGGPGTSCSDLAVRHAADIAPSLAVGAGSSAADAACDARFARTGVTDGRPPAATVRTQRWHRAQNPCVFEPSSSVRLLPTTQSSNCFMINRTMLEIPVFKLILIVGCCLWSPVTLLLTRGPKDEENTCPGLRPRAKTCVTESSQGINSSS